MDPKLSVAFSAYDSFSSVKYLNKLQHLKKTMETETCQQFWNNQPNKTTSLTAKFNQTISDNFLQMFCNSSNTFGIDDLINPSGLITQITIAKKTAIVLSTLAIIANILSLSAIAKIRKKLNANLRLTTSLCIADILVALSLLLLSTNNDLLPYGEGFSVACLFQIFRGIRMGAHIMTLFNLLGLALDHYYAIVRTLHYKLVMSNTKITWSIIISWILSMILGFSDFYMPSKIFDHCQETTNSSTLAKPMNWCDRVSCTVFDSEHLVFAITMVTFASIIYCYVAIFVTLQRKDSLLVTHRRESTMMRRKKKGVCTTILILGTFVACWLPYCLFDITVIIIVSKSTESDIKQLLTLQKIHVQANFCLYDLILLNSLCDPIIYAWRMREVQRGYRNLARTLPCCNKYITKSFSTSSSSRSRTTTPTTIRSAENPDDCHRLTALDRPRTYSSNSQTTSFM